MALSLKECTCVARGTFNIYIFQPKWIEELMDLQSSNLQLSVDFSQPGLRATPAEGEDPSWTIRPDSVVVGSRSCSVDCGSYIARVLDHLPLTPVRAVGNNFTFAGEPQEASSQLASAFWLSQRKPLGLKRSDVGGSLLRDGVTYNVAVSLAESQLLYSLNVHRPAVNGDSATQAAGMFITDFDSAVDLAKELFDLEVRRD